MSRLVDSFLIQKVTRGRRELTTVVGIYGVNLESPRWIRGYSNRGYKLVGFRVALGNKNEK